MFDEFFYLLRQYGLDVSTTEWLTVQQALSLGLHRSSLTGFYDLCRAILCKSESEYDKFDQAFEEFFTTSSTLPPAGCGTTCPRTS